MRIRAVLTALVLGVLACEDAEGPAHMVDGLLALAPAFESDLASLIEVESVRCLLSREETEEVVVDTVVLGGFQSGTVELVLTVPVQSESEVFLLTLTLISPEGDTVFQGGPLEVTAAVGSEEPQEIAVPLGYIGVGSDAVEVQIVEVPATLFYGDTVTLVAEALDDAGEPIVGTPIVWVSRDTTMAVVADRFQGRVVGTSREGSVQIEAQLLTGQTDVVSLSLTQRAATIEVTPDAATLESFGETVQLTAAARDDNGQVIGGKIFTWTDLNPNVATVDQSGLVTATASGQATIQATVEGVAGHALVTVSVPGVAPLTSWAYDNPPSADYVDVWGTSSSDVFAVGYDGTIVHYNGETWSPMTSGTTARLYGVWGTSSTDVYVVGHDGTILHHDGETWNSMTSGTSSALLAVWGTSMSEVYAVGANGAVLHFDGEIWSPMTSGTAAPLHGVWGTSSGDVFAVGAFGTVVHYDGTTWSSMTSGTTENLADVWGTSSGDVYAVGVGGTILHFDGEIWSPMTSGTVEIIRGVWGTSSSDAYAVGQGGTIVHYDGETWSPMTSGTTEQLYGVWGTSSSNVYAVGSFGVIMRGSR